MNGFKTFAPFEFSHERILTGIHVCCPKIVSVGCVGQHDGVGHADDAGDGGFGQRAALVFPQAVQRIVGRAQMTAICGVKSLS